MARAFRLSLIAAFAGSVLLAGCEEGSKFPLFVKASEPADEAPTEGGPAAATMIEKDVEAPDVFAVNEPGLWDGRPSLGGVWMAHPEVADPERVLIRNEANGQSVVGALFRRERDNPGPRIQVSSDAAEALGMLAGQPSVLDVVVLRREQVEVPAAPSEETVVLAEATGSGIEATTLDDPIIKAEAAIDAAEDGTKVAAAAPATAATAAARSEPAPAPAPATSSLDRAYIQIGIYSVEENAQSTAAGLRNVGVIPTVRQQESSGKRFWRVIVGPASSPSDRREILAKVRDLGFEDAYYVTN